MVKREKYLTTSFTTQSKNTNSLSIHIKLCKLKESNKTKKIKKGFKVIKMHYVKFSKNSTKFPTCIRTENRSSINTVT